MKHTHWLRLTALLLTLLLLGMGVPAAGAADRPEDRTEALSALAAAYWSDDYFASMTLWEGETQALLDGEALLLEDAPVMSGDAVLLPAQAVDEVRARSGELRVQSALVTEAEAEALGLAVEAQPDGSILVTAPYQTRRLLVKFRCADAIAFHGAAAKVSLGELRYALQYETEEQARGACEALSAQAGVVYAEPDGVAVMDAPKSWGTTAMGAMAFQAELPAGRAEVLVAVVDTGVDAAHPFLAGRIAEGGKSFVEGSGDAGDENYHGTHVSGIVADATPANVKILPVKVLNSEGIGVNSLIQEGVRYAADQGARVINLSLSSVHAGDNAWQEAARYAADQGAVLVGSAGNRGADIRCFPGAMHNVIAVAASDHTGLPWSKSSYGSWVDLTAPGVKVNSAVPGNAYRLLSGTSMAVPHVSAAAALLITHSPDVAREEILPYLQAAASPWADTARTRHYGPGILNLTPRGMEEFLPAALQLAPGEIAWLQGNSCPPVFAQTFAYSSGCPAIAAAGEGGGVLALYPGQTTITAQRGGSAVHIPVTVEGTAPPGAESLSITGLSLTPPAQTEYRPGEALNTAGGKLLIRFSDGTSQEAALHPGFCRGYDPDQAGEQRIRVTLGGQEASFRVTVGQRAAELRIITLPDQLLHRQGEGLNLAGGVVELTYPDGSSEQLPMSHPRITATLPKEEAEEDEEEAEEQESTGLISVTLCCDEGPAASYLIARVNEAGQIDLPPSFRLRYRKDYLRFTNADKEYVRWELSREDVIAIDSKGAMTFLNRGSVTVELLLDCPGHELYRLGSFDITVVYTFWQWLLVIFFFGWAWL